MKNEIIELFLDSVRAEKGAAQNTELSYHFDLNQLAEFFQNKDCKNITSDDLKNFVHFLYLHSYAPRSILRKLSVVRDFFKFLLSEGIIKENPATLLEAPKKDKTLPDFLTEEDIIKLSNKAAEKNNFTGLRNAAMIVLMYACGLRVSELVNMPVSAINFARRIVFVKGKGSKERLVPIAQYAIEKIQNYLEYREDFLANRDCAFLFPSQKNPKKPVSREIFFKDLKNLAALCGISEQKVHPHVLRHSFATFLINNGTDLRSVQKLLGHENITTTEIYTHILPEKLKNTVQSNHPLAKIAKK